jgi:hypothetical protein
MKKIMIILLLLLLTGCSKEATEIEVDLDITYTPYLQFITSYWDPETDQSIEFTIEDSFYISEVIYYQNDFGTLHDPVDITDKANKYEEFVQNLVTNIGEEQLWMTDPNTVGNFPIITITISNNTEEITLMFNRDYEENISSMWVQYYDSKEDATYIAIFTESYQEYYDLLEEIL